MVVTSRVAFIAASISLAAISNTPTVEGVVLPLPVIDILRAQQFARYALAAREASPVLDLPRSIKDSAEEKDEKRKTDQNWKQEAKDEDSAMGILSSEPLLKLNVKLGNGREAIVLKRSAEQQFFHVRRGFGPQSDLHQGPGPRRRRSSWSHTPSINFIKARDESSHPPGHILLRGVQSKKDYGSLYIDSSTGEIDASNQKASIWYLISVPCPDNCDFKNCAAFATFDTSDKNRCITYTTSSTQPSGLRGDYCWAQDMAREEAALQRSQTFGFDPASGHLEPLPIGDSTSGQPSATKSLERRADGEEVLMYFRGLDSANQSNFESSNFNSTSVPSESTVTTSSAITDTSTSTATSTETTTLTVTVTEESEPTSTPADNDITPSAATASPTQAPTPLKVKVFGNASPSTSDGVAVASALSTTSAPSSTVTSTGAVDGDVVASSIAAEDSSSSAVTTTTAAARR